MKEKEKRKGHGDTYLLFRSLSRVKEKEGKKQRRGREGLLLFLFIGGRKGREGGTLGKRGKIFF